MMGQNDRWPATRRLSLHLSELRAPGRIFDRETPKMTNLTVLPVAKLMADSESETPISYLCLIVTIAPSRLVSEIFACDAQTDRRTDTADHYYSWLTISSILCIIMFSVQEYRCRQNRQ